MATRQAGLVHDGLGRLAKAHAANDLAQWKEARQDLDRAIVNATRRLEQTRAQLRDATPEVATAFASAEHEVAQDRDTAHAAEPPKGYAVVAREDELLAALRAPSVAGFAGRRDRVQAVLEQLAIAELRVLRARIASPLPQDELASEIWKLGPRLRHEVATFIENVDRRKARERAATVRQAPVIVAPEPESPDTKLRRAFEGDAIEADLITATATLDVLARRALAARLRSYRPGGGDDVAARFVRLDAVVRERIFMELAREPKSGAPAAAANDLDAHPGSIFAGAPSTRRPELAPAASTTSKAFDIHADAGFLAQPPSMLSVTAEKPVEPDPRDPMRAFRETAVDLSHDEPVAATPAASRKASRLYLSMHTAQVWAELAHAIGHLGWGTRPERAELDDRVFAGALIAGLHDRLADFDEQRLAELAYPDDVLAHVAPFVPTNDAARWVPAVATVVVQLLQRSVIRSVQRALARFVEASDALGGGVAPKDFGDRLPVSMPIDRIVIEAMARDITIAPTAGARKARPGAVVRPVTFAWQGARGPSLWNVARVEPGDATREEIAAALGATDSRWADHAYELAVIGPYVAVPAMWARSIPAAASHAPGAEAMKDSVADRLALLASVSEVVALSPAHPQGGKSVDVDRDLAESLILLEAIRKLLTPWELAAPVTHEILFIASQRDLLRHAPGEQRDAWSAIAAAQRTRLIAVAERARAVNAAATGDKRSPALAPFRRALEAMSAAAATSHIAEPSDAAMADASVAVTELGSRGFGAQLEDLDATMGGARDRLDHEGPHGPEDENDQPIRDVQARKDWAPYEELRGHAQSVERRITEGEQVDPAELEQVELEMQELTLRTQLHEMQLTLDQLSADQIRASEGLVAHVVASSRFTSLGNALQTIHTAIGEIFLDLVIDGRALPKDGMSHVGEEVAARKAALARAHERYAALGRERHLGEFLQQAAATIQHQATKTAITKLVTLLAAAVAVSWFAPQAAVALVGEGAAGVVAAGAIGVVGNASVQYLASAGERGADSYASLLTENAFYEIATAGIMGAGAKASHAAATFDKLLDAELARLEVLEARAATSASTKLANLATRTGAEVVQVSTHAIMGMAMGATYREMRHAVLGGAAPNAQGDEDFLIQAASVAAGKVLHASIAVHLPRFRTYAKLGVREGDTILAAAERLAAESKSISEHADPQRTVALFAERTTLVEKELAALDEIDATGRDDGLSQTDRAKLRGELKGQLSELRTRQTLELSWQMLGLRALGADVWTGSPAELEVALQTARDSGHTVEVGETSGELTHATIDGRAVELHALAAAAPRSLDDSVPAAAAPQGHDGSPAQTKYGHVWPGEIPAVAPPEVRAVFAEAREVYRSFAHDRFQGGPAARMHWAELLVAHGIDVDGHVRFVGERAQVEEIEHAPAPVHSGSGISAVREMGPRSGNTGHVTLERCEQALDELVGAGGVLANARRTRNVLEVRDAAGRRWNVEVGNPRAMSDDQMADSSHHADRDVLWVSDRLTDEQVPRALGAVLGKTLAALGHAGVTPEAGALDAMFAHRETAARQPRSTASSVKERATADSRLENVARIDAEIDLAIYRMGLTGPDGVAALDALPPSLATQVRAQLAHQAHVGFDPAAVIGSDRVAAPSHELGLPTSKVMADAPEHVHAYGAADYEIVLSLRAELEIIREIDTRTAHRDQPGTNGGTDIAKGETQRRASHVARARELMAELQLGGSDRAYLESRLRELAAVFPGVEKELVPSIEQRIVSRENSAEIHRRAEAFRKERIALQKQLTERVLAGKPFKTKRVVIGSGPSGLADVATLGVARGPRFIAPEELLVLGGRDLIDRIDPSFLWGQRAAVYDRATESHPAFADDKGVGTGALNEAVEDPGEFMHVGEMRDAMDLARERLGMVPVDAKVDVVETYAEKRAGSPDWEVPSKDYPVRVRATIEGTEVYVYTEESRIMSGPGNPRFPTAQFLAPAVRDEMIRTGALMTGDKLLEGADLKDKTVLVIGISATGAWATTAARDLQAKRVDWGHLAGGELGAGDPAAGGELRNHSRRDNTPSNDFEYAKTLGLDRTQPAADPRNEIHTTFDRIVRIEQSGEGAVVTFAKGPGENVELYTVKYDAIITSLGFETRSLANRSGNRPAWAQPSVGDMIGAMKMEPTPRSENPILTDQQTGRVVVGGYAVGDALNVSNEDLGNRQSDAWVLQQRRDDVKAQTSADSPDDRVVEGVGITARGVSKDGFNDGI
ncbi:MAG: hypothetical protein ABJE66_19155 [Deltaproteobacteria bacterium]